MGITVNPGTILKLNARQADRRALSVDHLDDGVYRVKRTTMFKCGEDVDIAGEVSKVNLAMLMTPDQLAKTEKAEAAAAKKAAAAEKKKAKAAAKGEPEPDPPPAAEGQADLLTDGPPAEDPPAEDPPAEDGA